MVKFAHIADCHIEGWKNRGLTEVNFESFKYAINKCISEKVDFILIAGDLFDNSYPSIETLTRVFSELNNVRNAGIKVYLIYGSHDVSVSNRTFLSVLESAGLCTSVINYEEQEDGRIKLIPFFHGDIAIYGYPGKKNSLEMEELKRTYIEPIDNFSILMLHTTIKDVVGTIPMKSILKDELPIVNYYALGHIHKRFELKHNNGLFVYPGPTFPNNFNELEELECGSFNIVEVDNDEIKTQNILIPTNEVIKIEIEITNAYTAVAKILKEIRDIDFMDKIVLLRLNGQLTSGKRSDIKFKEIEDILISKGAIKLLTNNTRVKSIAIRNIKAAAAEALDVDFELSLQKMFDENKTGFGKYFPQFIDALSTEKKSGETKAKFADRLVKDITAAFEMGDILEN